MRPASAKRFGTWIMVFAVCFFACQSPLSAARKALSRLSQPRPHVSTTSDPLMDFEFLVLIHHIGIMTEQGITTKYFMKAQIPLKENTNPDRLVGHGIGVTILTIGNEFGWARYEWKDSYILTGEIIEYPTCQTVLEIDYIKLPECVGSIESMGVVRVVPCTVDPRMLAIDAVPPKKVTFPAIMGPQEINFPPDSTHKLDWTYHWEIWLNKDVYLESPAELVIHGCSQDTDFIGDLGSIPTPVMKIPTD
ncbi:MAG: hypothetical protein JW748_10775 [Anaerolineales bacterium]|nr:hypothetical protein [Anaerolineales bacterium]